jgi:HEAT repeat protein
MPGNFDLVSMRLRCIHAFFLRCPVFLASACLLSLAACTPSAEQRLAAIHELQARPTPRNLERLRVLATDADRDVRASALDALATCRAPDAAEVGLAALQDDDAMVRATAARLLGELGQPEHAAVLAQSLVGDRAPRVRQRAAESLTRLGGESAVAALLVGLEDEAAEVRLAAVRGLRDLDPASGVSILSRRVVEDPAWEVRVQAARALGEAGDPEVLAALQAALEDPNEHVRAAAAAAVRAPRARPAPAEAEPAPGTR